MKHKAYSKIRKWFQLQFLRRSLLIWFQKKYKPLTSRGSLLVLGVSVVFLGFSFFGSNFAVKLIYDPEINPIIPRWLLTVAIVSPVVLIYLNFLVLTRIIIDRLRKKTGTMLRFRIVGFFLISLTVPSVFFMVLFLNLYDYTIKIFNNQLLLDKLEENLRGITTEFEEEMLYMEASLALLGNEFQLGKPISIQQIMQTPLRRDSKLIFYKDRKPVQIILLRSALSSLQPENTDEKPTFFNNGKIPHFPFGLLLNQNNPTYSSYDERGGFLFSLQQTTSDTIDTSNFLALVTPVERQKKNDIDQLLSGIAGLRQFQLITGPLRLAFLFTVFYLYLQVFSISVLIFYQRSNKYLTPIQDLIQATKSIATSSNQQEILSALQINKALNKINHHIKKMDKDEIHSLLRAFRQMALELQHNRKRIQQTSEIEGWKEVAKRIAHEIKNPLTPIQLAVNTMDSEIAKLDLTTYEKLLPSINLINSEVSRIGQLAGELSQLSKVQQLNKRACNFSLLLKKISNYFAYREDIHIDISKAQLPFLYIDEEKIYGIFINLIKNSLQSIDSMSKKELYNKPNSSTIFLRSKIIRINKKRYAEITVTDHGVGISPENKEEIFKPYFTLKSSGTGLGLAICQQIAFAHDGNLWLANSNNLETTLALTLPVERLEKNLKQEKQLIETKVG